MGFDSMLRRTLVAIAVAAMAAPSHAVDPGSQLIACDQADSLVTVSVSSHLDPSCTWTRGIEIVASDVVLDCQGARIAPTTSRQRGILITAPTTVALSNIVVRNCQIEGFLNNIRLTREGFRDLAEGAEYEHAWSNIVIEDSTLLNSRGSGLFVDGYVTGVTLRRLHIEGSGSVGIYLEAGSKDNVVEDNDILNNGYGENGPAWQPYELGGATFWFSGTGREGLAIDGSRDNRVVNNRFAGNAAGAIFLYKNCGEYVNERPDRWWQRRYGADGNVIEGNTLTGGRNGIWIGSRMGENVFPMDCSDPAYQFGIVRDFAADNVVRANVFDDVTFGVRVEDDRNVVEDNEFTSDDAAHQAVIVGTPYRTSALGLPVDGTRIAGNRAFIAGNGNPYRWVHGHVNTTTLGNESFGRRVGFCEGVPPVRGPFVMAVAVVAGDPDTPPAGDPPVLPPPEALPPCPLACATPTTVERPRIDVRRLDTPPGDDTLTFQGRMTLPQPFTPALDPIATGGSKSQPGLVQFKVKGKRGSWPVDPARLPLTGLVVLDPPTTETGQCGQAMFPGPAPACIAGAKAIRCR